MCDVGVFCREKYLCCGDLVTSLSISATSSTAYGESGSIWDYLFVCFRGLDPKDIRTLEGFQFVRILIPGLRNSMILHRLSSRPQERKSENTASTLNFLFTACPSSSPFCATELYLVYRVEKITDPPVEYSTARKGEYLLENLATFLHSHRTMKKIKGRNTSRIMSTCVQLKLELDNSCEASVQPLSLTLSP